MGMFANLRVGTRLGAGFGLLLVLILAMAGLAQFTQRTVGDATDKITQKDFPKVHILYEIRQVNTEGGSEIERMFGLTDQNEIKRIAQERAATGNRLNDLYKQLSELISSAEGKAMLADLTAARKAYVPIRLKTLELLANGNREEALKGWTGEGLPALEANRKQIQRLLDLQQKRVEEGSKEIAAANGSASLMMNSVAALALLLGAVMAFLITRSLLKQLGGEPEYAASVAQRIASGDLTVEVETKATDSSSLLAAMKAMQQQLTTTVKQIKESTETITTASGEIASGNADLSQRTEEQASSLEETASSMEELTATVKQNAENAKQANQLALGASSVAVKGGAVVGQVVETMSSINESSKKIVDIISVIDGIAFQTNILALNAAVEAARAGEQGRGFAVVASEVRSLAQRSAAAAKEIKGLITDSVDKVDNGTRLVGEAGKTMDEIVSSVKRVTDIMAEIAAASQEQSSGIAQVNQAVMQMDEVTQQNAALVEEAAAAAESLQEQAQSLTQAVSVFKVAESEARVAVTAPPPRTATVTALKRRKPAEVKRALKAAPMPQTRKVANTKGGDAAEWREF
jgi:methyl-accepting chemotaxis protein